MNLFPQSELCYSLFHFSDTYSYEKQCNNNNNNDNHNTYYDGGGDDDSESDGAAIVDRTPVGVAHVEENADDNALQLHETNSEHILCTQCCTHNTIIGNAREGEKWKSQTSTLSNSQQHRMMNSFCTYEKQAEKSTTRHSKYTSSHTYSYHRRYIDERVNRRRRTLSYPSRSRPSSNYSIPKSHLIMKSSVCAPCPTRRSYIRTISKHNVNNHLSSPSSSSSSGGGGGGGLFNEFVSWIHGLFSRPNSSQSATAAATTTTLSPYDIIDTSESKLYNIDIKSPASDHHYKRAYSAPIRNNQSYHNITRQEDNEDDTTTTNTNTSEADDMTTDFKDLTRNFSALTHTPSSPPPPASSSSCSSSCLQFSRPPDTETSYYTPNEGMTVTSSRTEVMVVVGLSVAEIPTNKTTTAMNSPLSPPPPPPPPLPPVDHSITPTSKTNSLKSSEIMLTENNSISGGGGGLFDNCQSIIKYPRKSQNITEFYDDDDDNEGDRFIRPDLTEIQSSVLVAVVGNRESDKHLTASFQNPSVITNPSSGNFNKNEPEEISKVSVTLTTSSPSGKLLNQQRINQGAADDNTNKSVSIRSSNHPLRQQVNDSNFIFEINLQPELCALKGIAYHTDQALTTEINDSVLFNKQLQYVNTQLPLQDKHKAINVKGVKYISYDNVIHINQDSETVYYAAATNGEQISQLIPAIQNPSSMNTHHGKQCLTGNSETSEQILSPTFHVEMNELHRSPLPGVAHYYDKYNSTDHRILATEGIAASQKLLEKRLSDIHHQGTVLDRVPPSATTTTTTMMMMTGDGESEHSKLLCMNQFGEGILSGLLTSQLRLARKCSSYESEKQHWEEEEAGEVMVDRVSLGKKIKQLQQKITIMPEQIYHCKSNIEMDHSINTSIDYYYYRVKSTPATINQDTVFTEKTQRNDHSDDEEIYQQHATTPSREANFSPEKIIYSPIDFKHQCLLNRESPAPATAAAEAAATAAVTSDDMHETVLEECENDQNTIIPTSPTPPPLLNTYESLELSELHKTDTKIQDVLVSQQISSKYANSFPIPTQVEVDVVLGSTSECANKDDEVHHEKKKKTTRNKSHESESSNYDHYHHCHIPLNDIRSQSECTIQLEESIVLSRQTCRDSDSVVTMTQSKMTTASIDNLENDSVLLLEKDFNLSTTSSESDMHEQRTTPVNMEIDLSNSLSDTARCNSHLTRDDEVVSNRRRLGRVVEINPTMMKKEKFLKYASSLKTTTSKLPHDNFITDDNKMYPEETPSEILHLDRIPVVEMKNPITEPLDENTETIKESSTPVHMKEVIQENYTHEQQHQQQQPDFTATDIRPPNLTGGYSNKLDKTSRIIQWENVQTNEVYTTVDVVYKQQDTTTAADDDDNDEMTVMNRNTMTIPISSHHDESLTETDDDIQISLGQHTPYHHNKSTGGINNTQDTTVENEEEGRRKCRGTATPEHEVNFKQEDVQNDSIIITTQRSLLHQKQSLHESKENIYNEKNDDKHSGDSGSETFDHKQTTHPHPAQKPVKPILRSDDSSVTTHVEEESTFYSTMHQRRIDLQFLDILNRTRMIGGKMMLTEYSPEQYYKETLIIPELLCQTQHNSFEQNHRLNDIHGSSTSSRSSLQLDGNRGCGVGGVSEYAHDSTLTENEASYRSIAPTRKALQLGAIEEMLCAPLVNTGIHKEASRSDEAVFDALKGSGEEKPVAYFVEQECQNNQESHCAGRIYMPLTPTIEIQTTPLLGVPLNQYTMTTCCSVEVKAEKENGESREWGRTTKKEEAMSDDIVSLRNQQQHPTEQSSNKAVMQKPINAYLSDIQNQNSKANDNKLNLITNFTDNSNKKAHLKKRSISLSLDKLTRSRLSISKFILRLKIRSRSLGRLDLHHLSIEEGKVSGVDDSDDEEIEISARIHPFNFKEGIHKEANLGQTIFATEQSSYNDEIGFRRDVPQERSDDKVEKTETEKRQIWENEAVIETQLPPPPPPLNTEDSFCGSQTKHMEQLEAIDQPVLLKEDNTKNLKFKIEAEKTISEIQSPTQTQQEQEQDGERNEAYNDHDDDQEEEEAAARSTAAESKRLSLPLPIEIGGGEGNDSFVEKYEIVPRRTNEETDDDQLEAISSEQSDENAEEEEDMHMTTTTSSCGEESAKHSSTSNLLLLSPSIKEPHCANEIILESSLSYNEVNRQTTAKLTYTTTTASVPAHMNEFLTISMTSIVSPSIHYRSELSFTHQHSEQIKTSTPTTLSKLSETPVPTKSGESTTSSSIYYTAQSNPSGYGEIEVEVNEQDVVRSAAAASVDVDKKDSYDESTLKEEVKTPMQNDDDAVINEAERETTGTETVKASSSSSSPSPSSQSGAQPDHLHQIEEVEGEEESTEHVDELIESIEEVNVEAIQSSPDILNYSLSENIVTYNVDEELNEQIAVVSLEVDHAQPSDIVDIHDMDTDTGVSKQLHLTQITTEQPLDDDENHQFQELTDATEPLVDDSQPPITVARTVEVERHHDDDHDDELGEVSMNRQQPYQTTSHPINIKETSKVMQEHSAKSENKILLKQTHETVKMEDKQPEMKTIHEEKYHDLYNVKDAREKNVPYESVNVLDRVPDTITSGLERKEEAESRSPKLVKKQHAVVMRETPIINTAPPQPDDNDDDAADDRQAKSTKLEISKVPVVMDNLTLAKTDTRADTPVIEFKTVDSPFEIRIKPMEVLQATGKSVSQTFDDNDELDEIKHPETSDIHLPEMFTLNEYEDKCEVKELTTTRGEDEEEHCQQMKHEKESPPTTNSVVVCVLVQVQQTPDTIIMRKEDNEMLTTPDELKQSYSLMDNEEEEEQEAEGEIVQTEGVDMTDYYLQSPLEDKITTDKEDEEEQAYHDIKVNQYHKTNVTTKFNLTVNHFDIDDKMFSSQSGRDIQPPTDLSSETQRLPSPLSPSPSSSSEVVDHHEIMQRQEDEEAEEDATMKRHFTQLKEDVNILKITSKCTYTSTPLKNYSLRQRTTTTRIPSSSFERSTSPQEYTLASTVCLPHSDGTTTTNTTTTATYSESPYPAPTSSPSMTNLGWLLDSSSCLISRFDERLNKHLIEVSPNNRIFKKATITETSHHQLPTITATDQSPSQEQTTTTAARHHQQQTDLKETNFV
ncbi:unnamed protein product [Trichobilharzia szidati]|nr:unnamed protein product [Trichobilharzia szidati]